MSRTNAGKQSIKYNAAAASAPKGEAKVEVKAAQEYEDDLDDMMARLLSKNKTTALKDGSAKSRGKCKGCGKPVTQDQVQVRALEAVWHEHCFKCSVCDVVIDHRKGFFERAGQAVCESC